MNTPEISSLERLVERIDAKVDVLQEHIFIGAPGRPSIREDIAVLKAGKWKVPPAVWKGVAALLVAIATLVGGLATSGQLSQASEEAPPEAPAMVSK